MSPTTTAGKRILLVDDNIVTRETLSMVLGGEGYQVATACNGEDALEWMRHFGKPCLILLDLHMPHMDGSAFGRKLSQDPKFAAIPVVIISADEEIAKEATALGALNYVQKPVDPIQLLTILRRCCP